MPGYLAALIVVALGGAGLLFAFSNFVMWALRDLPLPAKVPAAIPGPRLRGSWMALPTPERRMNLLGGILSNRSPAAASSFEVPRAHSLWARASRALLVSAALLLLAGMGLFFLAADYFLGATAYPWFLLAAASSALAVGFLGRRLLRSTHVWVAGVALACSVLILRFVDLSPVKPFCRFYLGLHQGQSKGTVLEDLNRHFPVDGRFARPVIDGLSTDRVLILALDPNDGMYDSEFIYVHLENERVSSTSYEGD